MSYSIECVVNDANHLGEGPIWDVEEGVLYWVDGTGRRVGNPSIWRLDPRTGQTKSWSLEHDVGAMALRQGGGAVLALDLFGLPGPGCRAPRANQRHSPLGSARHARGRQPATGETAGAAPVARSRGVGPASHQTAANHHPLVGRIDRWGA